MDSLHTCLAHGCQNQTPLLYCDACRHPATQRERAEPEQRAAPDGQLEASVQEDIRQALLAAGWQVWRVGQRDARGTQDPGVSDLIALRERVVFLEMKRSRGDRQSEAQREFQAACADASVTYVLAKSLADVEPFLAPPQRAS